VVEFGTLVVVEPDGTVVELDGTVLEPDGIVGTTT
jgi:hypothetical protein